MGASIKGAAENARARKVKRAGIPLSAGMILVTLGVVYGDIGTSPMYTLKAIMSGNGGLATMSTDVVLGALSLIIWTLTLITTVKYVLVAMKADNHNEGGIFALYSLVKKCGKWLIIPAMVGGAALLADGILTPAVTVTTAIEGLRTVDFCYAVIGDNQNIVVAITIAILCILFAMQRAGTSTIGKFFGPVMTLWFLFLGVSGLVHVIGNVGILRALNPLRGITFLFDGNLNAAGLMVLGNVFLCTTGAEALYSDMGHVGKSNIYASWPFVKTCLIINYLGQGAWILANNANGRAHGRGGPEPVLPDAPRAAARVRRHPFRLRCHHRVAGADHGLVLHRVRSRAPGPHATHARQLPVRDQGPDLHPDGQQHHVGRLHRRRPAVPQLKPHGGRLRPGHHRHHAR